MVKGHEQEVTDHLKYKKEMEQRMKTLVQDQQQQRREAGASCLMPPVCDAEAGTRGQHTAPGINTHLPKPMSQH